MGDALILRELIRLVSSRSPTTVYLSKAPANFREMLAIEGVASVESKTADGYLPACVGMLASRLRGVDCYYFLTPGGINGERSRYQFLADMLRMAVIIALAIAGVKVCQVAFSLERIGPRHARLLRWRSRFLSVCAPRDSLSLQYAKELGIRITGEIPDLAFNLFSENASLDDRTQKAKHIAISFRLDKAPGIINQLESTVRSICANLDDDAQLICVAQVGRDAEPMRRLYGLGNSLKPGQVRFVDCHESIEAALAIYGTCEAVVSNRLHVLLLALRAGASPVALTVSAVDTKILGIFSALGMRHRVHDISAWDVADVAPLEDAEVLAGNESAMVLANSFDGIFSRTPRGAEPVVD